LEIESQYSKNVSETVLFIPIKIQVQFVYLPLGTSWETVSVGENNNKKVFSVDSTFSGLDMFL
jgi:hypothetical protein